MRFLKNVSKHRKKVVPALVALALVLSGLAFRSQITAWFTGQPVSSTTGAATGQQVGLGPFSATVKLSPDPPKQKGNRLVAEVRTSQGEAVEGAKVSLRYRMPPMGAMQEMKGNADVEEQEAGRYVATFDLPMSGSWELLLQVDKGDKKGSATFNLTVGTPGLTLKEQSIASTGGDSKPSPSHQFQPANLERLRAAYAAYEQIRSMLAQDSAEHIDSQAKQLSAALEAASEGNADAPETIKSALGSAMKAAQELAGAADPAGARKPFGDLSRELVMLANADPRLAEGLHLFECPMADGYPKWLQISPKLENPYMGQKMLTCGEPSEWSESNQEKEHVHEATDGDEISHYTCAMHPSVKEDSPDSKCPICSMDLTPVTKQQVETGTIFVDEVRRQRIGVRTDPAERREMTLRLRGVGAVAYDESRLRDVNLRMSGWVQRLYVDESGQAVKAGQTLFTLYSPELYAAQLEHLSSFKRQEEGGEMLTHLADASRSRLRLLGMSGGQIASLEKRGEAQEYVPIPSPASGYVVEKQIVQGARVDAGMRVYRIADLSKIWVDAEIYEADLPHVKVDQRAVVELPYVPGKTFEGKVDYVYPTLEGKTRTGKARIVLDNPELELKPQMYANVILEVELGKRLAIPDSAVVYTGPRRLVFVDLGEGRLQPKVVKLGVHVDGFYEVTDGLSAGDVVVTSGNFLIAAESRIRSAAQYWESSDAAK